MLKHGIDSLNVHPARGSGDASDVADPAALLDDSKRKNMSNEPTLENMLAVLLKSFDIEPTPRYTLEEASNDLFNLKEVMYYQDASGAYPVSAVPYSHVLEILERLRKAGVK